MMLFRSCGIVITQSALTNIFVSLLYSGYPLDLNMKEYIYKLFHNNNIVTLTNLITLYRDFRNNTIFVLLVNHQKYRLVLLHSLAQPYIQMV